MKNEIIDYWSQRASSFSNQKLRELTSDQHNRWLNEILRVMPSNEPLAILDLGTGSGFFSFLLSALGHRTTGIDITGRMIEEAKKTAEHLNLQSDFYVMDAENPSFPTASFDVLISRNLTWTLPHLDSAYKAWHSLLKPGGFFVNFDADYCHEKKGQQATNSQAHKEVSDQLMQRYEDLKGQLGLQQYPRPEWDRQLLLQAGFCDICVDTTVGERIYRTRDEFYNPTPIFMITARASLD